MIASANASPQAPVPRLSRRTESRIHAQAKASAQHDQAGRPYRSFRGLLEHLATLTRNQVRFTGTSARRADQPQRHAFDLIGAPIPLTLA